MPYFALDADTLCSLCRAILARLIEVVSLWLLAIVGARAW
jgi:hypothetical protein